ncbi:MAG TPA: hypothetical protein VJV39_05385 [Dongiaceae bacterium]|nr:hypothetical protein [Dongiaceae bacterium]
MSQSVAEALAAFRQRNGIPHDEVERATWVCRLGPLSIRLPNFSWRRRAILAHDLHHLVTAYPCTLRGECQMAAWEFGAGQMPHWGARLFCLPLVLLGVVWSPRSTWRAFLSGRQSTSLHGAKLDQRALAAPFDSLHAELAAPRRAGVLPPRLLFARLVVEAVLIVSAPLAMIAGLWLALGA